MLLVDAADTAQTVNGCLVVQMAYQCIAGIRRQCDDSAAVNDLRSLLDQTKLRVFWMYLKKLAHKKERRSEPTAALLIVIVKPTRVRQQYVFQSVDAWKTVQQFLMRHH